MTLTPEQLKTMKIMQAAEYFKQHNVINANLTPQEQYDAAEAILNNARKGLTNQADNTRVVKPYLVMGADGQMHIVPATHQDAETVKNEIDQSAKANSSSVYTRVLGSDAVGTTANAVMNTGELLSRSGYGWGGLFKNVSNLKTFAWAAKGTGKFMPGPVNTVLTVGGDVYDSYQSFSHHDNVGGGKALIKGGGAALGLWGGVMAGAWAGAQVGVVGGPWGAVICGVGGAVCSLAGHYLLGKGADAVMGDSKEEAAKEQERITEAQRKGPIELDSTLGSLINDKEQQLRLAYAQQLAAKQGVAFDPAGLSAGNGAKPGTNQARGSNGI